MATLDFEPGGGADKYVQEYDDETVFIYENNHVQMYNRFTQSALAAVLDEYGGLLSEEHVEGEMNLSQQPIFVSAVRTRSEAQLTKWLKAKLSHIRSSTAPRICTMLMKPLVIFLFASTVADKAFGLAWGTTAIAVARAINTTTQSPLIRAVMRWISTSFLMNSEWAPFSLAFGVGAYRRLDSAIHQSVYKFCDQWVMQNSRRGYGRGNRR